jgi:hypothetical protein
MTTPREIKFRAWDTKAKRLVDIENLRLGLDGHLANSQGKYLDYESRYILMQYTGLNDKNGKEIYEGDIVRGSNDQAVPQAPREVRFQISGGWVADNLALWAIHLPIVLGNIYENPELLSNPQPQ